jgi:hypothetical protein
MSLKLHLFVRQQYNMDAIDITDAAFALDTPTIDSIIDKSGEGLTDYSIFISIGVAILACIIGFFAYKFYQNKNSEQDCPGGFCTMENRTMESQQSSRTL